MQIDHQMDESLRDVAIKLSLDQIKNENNSKGPKERSIFILGSKQTGKTTLLNHILERGESPKPTLALEYSFGRRTSHGQGIRRQICHIWELGGFSNNVANLTGVPIAAHGLHNLTIIIMLDLAQPSKLWTDLENAIACLKPVINAHEEVQLLRDTSEDRIGANHVDRKTLDVFPVPLLIVGGRYDIFQDLDPEVKKCVCRALRSAAHHLGASLFFYSNKDSGLQKKARDILNNFGFGSSGSFKGISQDYNKPMLIPFGADSWEDIGISPGSFDKITVMYTSQFPQTSRVAALPDDPSTDSSFREPVIDSLRNQKDDELQRLILESDRKKWYAHNEI